MDVDDAMGIGIDEETGNQRQEAGQNNELDAILLKQRHHDIGVVKFGLGGDSRGNTKVLGTDQCVGIKLVADYERAIYTLGASKVFNQVLAVGTAA